MDVKMWQIKLYMFDKFVTVTPCVLTLQIQ